MESLWVSPRLRGQGLDGRLVNYLIETRRQDGIQRFYFWVPEDNNWISDNQLAVGLYEHMKFLETGQVPRLDESPVREVQYMMSFDSDLVNHDELVVGAAARDKDRRRYGVTYRILGRTV
jgi:ribosomal protein S18 acetylase RimI-like enzyme